MTTTHVLKTWPEEFEALWAGIKKFDYRIDDGRGFKLSDRLELREYFPTRKYFTGRVVNATVTHIVRGPMFGVPEGFVVMSLDKMSFGTSNSGYEKE